MDVKTRKIDYAATIKNLYNPYSITNNHALLLKYKKALVLCIQNDIYIAANPKVVKYMFYNYF